MSASATHQEPADWPLPRLAAVVAGGVGVAVLLAWAVGMPALARLVPQRPPMVPRSAVMLVLLAAGLWLLAPTGGRGRGDAGGRPPPAERRGPRIVAWLLAAIALFLAGDAIAVLLGVADRAEPLHRFLLERGAAGSADRRQGWPSIHTAVSALLGAFALFGFEWRVAGMRVSRALAALLLAVVLVAGVGLVYDAPALFGSSPAFGMSIPAAVGFGALALGLLLDRPGEGMTNVLLARGAGGALARRLLPVALLLPLALGGLVALAEREGAIDQRNGIASLVAGMILLLGVAVVWSAAMLERRETERARLLEEAEAARARADAANLAKSRFLATMSHELRTPLNAILGYTELLEIGVAGPVTSGQRDYHERVRASGRHLLDLINEVLDFSKLEAGHMTVAREEGSLVEGVGAALGLVRPQATARRIALAESIECDHRLRYLGDSTRVRQILVNLLSNAVKFTEPGGRVELACGRAATNGPFPSPTGEWVRIAVQDTGIGIAPAEQARVFEPFVQVQEGHTRERGGTGLGLAISRRFARLMSGELTLASEPGRGSTFTLWLPAAPAVRAAATKPTARCFDFGECVKAAVETIVSEYVDRLRADPLVPLATHGSDEELENHTAALLTDLAQHFIILDHHGRDVHALLRDGIAIQHDLSVRHGMQRRRLGWGEAALRREFVVLRDTVADHLRRTLAPEDHAQAADVMPLLDHFLAQVEAASVEGFWREGTVPGR